MSSVQIKRINGYGPYAYKVEWEGGEQHWEYLGKASEIDVDGTDDTYQQDEDNDDGTTQLVGDVLEPRNIDVSIGVYNETLDAITQLHDNTSSEWVDVERVIEETVEVTGADREEVEEALIDGVFDGRIISNGSGVKLLNDA